MDVSHHGCILRFLLIQLKPKHNRLDVLTTHITVCICHAELKSYLLTYLLGAKRPGDELTKGRIVHKSTSASPGNVSCSDLHPSLIHVLVNYSVPLHGCCGTRFIREPTVTSSCNSYHSNKCFRLTNDKCALQSVSM